MAVLRPELHVTADDGILEGPAGVIRLGKEGERVWHMFYQYKPAPGGASRWGHHASEDDPFSWYECNDAIVPVDGETQVRAGAVVGGEAADGGVDMYFTSVSEAGNQIKLARVADVDELCDDLDDDLDVSAAAERLDITIEGAGEWTNFRSPCVIPGWFALGDRNEGHQGWLMLAVAGGTDAPKPVVLSSADGRSWTFEGPLEFDGDPGIELDETLVAPRLVRLRDQVDGKIYDVLFLTIERDNKDYSSYIIGRLEGNTFTVVTPSQLFDHGHDFTRPRNTNYARDVADELVRYERAYIYGFMTDSGRNGDPTSEPNWEREGWANALTLPRRVTLQHGHLYQVPAPGLPNAIDEAERALLWTALCEIPDGSEIVAEVVEADGSVAVRITHDGERIELDRFDGSPKSAALHDDDEDNITVIVDGSTIEVYAGGGSVVMSSRFWPENPVAGIRVRTSGDAAIHSEWRRGHTTLNF
ncbi:GH32 C-terminal domain-containing protein [Corynebacterium sp. TA-R-1]|uniref:GH32 C-terminal domain-containing protein n=1 Tax=Corynebacterium stercoris TaxID=2943490 RepID=A0ABT1G024_9CORY|nr:GH32 C-terminal domain-containing protein [Corynebacterium stercoris]MCP1387385.1 GH32 C-terminal domain-containing protein [Corynebacterium stercoris]